MKQRLSDNEQKLNRQIKNVEKHLRIAKALGGGKEAEHHIAKAQKLAEKYKFELEITRSK